MRKGLFFSAIVVLVLLFSVVFKIAVALYAPSPGALRIKSNPLGSVIVLDNKQIGTTPYKDHIPPGDHTLRLINNVGENKLAWEKAISIAPDGQTEINLDFGPGELFHAGELLQSDIGDGLLVATEPAEAELLVDDQPSGKAPAYLDTLNPGKHTLRINKAGYISRDITINIVPGTRLAASFYLSKDPLPEEPKLLESDQNYALYGIYTDDPVLLDDPQQWSKGVFFLQKDSEADQNKLITEIVDFQGHIFSNPDTKGGSLKVVGYIGPKGQPLTQEAQRKYYELMGREVAATPLVGQRGTIVNSPTDSVNLRANPSISSIIVGQVKMKDTVDLLEEKNGWYRIRGTLLEGWVSQEFVQKL